MARGGRKDWRRRVERAGGKREEGLRGVPGGAAAKKRLVNVHGILGWGAGCVWGELRRDGRGEKRGRNGETGGRAGREERKNNAAGVCGLWWGKQAWRAAGGADALETGGLAERCRSRGGTARRGKNLGGAPSRISERPGSRGRSVCPPEKPFFGKPFFDRRPRKEATVFPGGAYPAQGIRFRRSWPAERP